MNKLPSLYSPTPITVKLTPEDVTRIHEIIDARARRLRGDLRLSSYATASGTYGGYALAKQYDLPGNLAADPSNTFTLPATKRRVHSSTVISPSLVLYLSDETRRTLADDDLVVLCEWQPPQNVVRLIGSATVARIVKLGEPKNDGMPGIKLTRDKLFTLQKGVL